MAMSDSQAVRANKAPPETMAPTAQPTLSTAPSPIKGLEFEFASDQTADEGASQGAGDEAEFKTDLG